MPKDLIKILIIGSVWPEPQSTAAGLRMIQLIQEFLKRDYTIRFVCAAQPTPYSANLNDLNIITENIILNDSSFDEQLKIWQPDIVIFDRFMTEEQYGWRVSENCPDAVKILDTEDLHFLRKARETAFKENRYLVFKDYFSTMFYREMAAMLRCDISLIISEFEYKLLTETFSVNPEALAYLPFFSETISDKDAMRMSGFIERKNFMTIGNFMHEPNWQSVLKLHKIWGEIKKVLPDSELHVYGSYVTPKAEQLHNPKIGFYIKGRAESVEKVMQEYRVCLAPIPFGAGLKGKLLDAMKNGLPSVTTPIGAESMCGKLDWNGLVCENDDDFIEKAVTLYNNEKIWNQSIENGFKIVNTVFAAHTHIESFFKQLEVLQNDLKKHRNQNFIGQILQYHTVQSTKYLSKWIEEKNRK
ncbi:MAG: glycosyltransferase [Flavobacteriaceae bacterium]|jgi:glycosyltransferase involved in cell wall biosynthesis|nr:glycosyltransferase [Flavobacteriaceae bacterium]